MSRTSDLVKAMVDIRDQNRAECGRHLFELLGYCESAFITEPQLDELLFKVVRKRLGTTIYADMVLMAFGLLPGYEYNSLYLGARRIKFLRESNWLKVNRKSKIKDFDSASKDDQDVVLKSLPNVEKYWMGKIADELIEHVDQKDKNGNKIQNGLEKYIKLLDRCMDEVRDASGKITDYVLKTPPPPPDDERDVLDDEDDAPDDEVAGSDETSKQNELEEPSSDESNVPPPQADAPPKKTPPPGEPEVHPSDPPPSANRRLLHIGSISIGSLINIDPKVHTNVNLTWSKNSIFLVVAVVALAAMVAVVVRMSSFRPQVSPEGELPPKDELASVEEIFVTNEDITLTPNERRELAAAVLPIEATGATLSYASSDTSVVTVNGHNGMLQAQDSHAVGGVQSADIIIQAENGVTTTKTVFVNFSEGGYDAPVEDIDNFVPRFLIIQKVRLAGTTEWATSVNAEIGDIVEIQIKYKNINEIKHDNVMIRDILPPNLEYIAGTTKLYNVQHDGSGLSDGITNQGVNIGNYTPGSDAYVCFSAKVDDVNLAPGSNTLVNWSQGGVGPVTLQDYAAVVVQK